ncbi:MAG: MotA/TolQ/ExbB proton channel family protein [Isosphaeraceae bacterium]
MARSTPSPHALRPAILTAFLIAASTVCLAQEAGKTTPEQPATLAPPSAAPDAGPSSLPPTAPAAKPGVNRGSVRQLVFQANPMLWPLAACSIFTLGIALERWLAIRRKRVLPAEFVDRFLERLSTGKLDRERALELCKAHESPAARVFGMVIKAWGQPGATIRQTLSHDAAGEVVELKRNLRVLSGMATIGPLLGLLGTVVGIIQSFDALGGRVGPARGEALAQGISLALVATAFGLVIAIFAVAAYYYLLNRVDVLVRELDEKTRQVIDLVSSETVRPLGSDRRHGAISTSEPLRQETRVY